MTATAVLAGGSPALAAHGPDSDCAPGFSSQQRWQDRSGSTGPLLIAGIAADIADDIGNSIGVAITGAVVQVLRVIAYGIEVRNEITLACVIGNHWNDQDTLLLLGLQSGLAVTTTPDAAALVPGPTSDPAPGTNPYDVAPDEAKDIPLGFLDRPATDSTTAGGGALPQGVKQLVAQVLDDMEKHTGCACAQARAHQAEAERLLATGSYKAAYAYFRRAYVAAVTAADGSGT